ncbi:MAG: DUF6519 domain-containing protein, partial [Ignavibacteria bacterium]
MASGDISRIAFNPHKHYTSVRMQQGRVTIDDDWNENERIENEDKRKVRIDIIGAFGSPDQGFKIINLNQTSYNFDIQAGNFYIGGLRLEMESDEKFRGQSDWLQQSDKKYPIPTLNDDEERFDLVYLEAWQQPVSAVEDSELFEVALGGPDTSTRIRNMRRVMIKEDIKSGNCGTAWQNFIDDWEQDKKEKHERIPDTKLKVGFIEGIKHD